MSNTDPNHTKYLKSLSLITKNHIMVATRNLVTVDTVNTVDTNTVAPPTKDYPVATKAMDGIKLDHIEPF